MCLSGSRGTRRCTWFLILAFSLFSTPHSGLCLSYAADLLVSAAYAGEQTEARPPQGGDAQQTPPQMMMAGPGGTAGSITGAPSPSINVSPFAGTATARIPIEVPPGRKGIAPQLALTYSSHQGSGWIGMGWNIDMGAIQRATKRGVDYTTNNYTAVINGSSSELVPRTDWGTNYYGARIEGTLSKYYYNTGTGGWEATSRDGTKYYYGSTSASRQDFDSGTKIFKWCLDKVQDTNGNYMTVSYTKDQGEIYLDRIDYTGNTITPLGTTHYVKFHLEPRTDVPIMFTPNYQAKTAKRLKTIEVRSQGAMVRAYSLTYGASARTARSLLSTVQQFGNDAILDGEGTITGGTALPETAVTYSGEDSGTFSAPVVTATPDFSSYTKTIADVNGDGRADLVYLNNVRIVVWLSKGDGTFADRIVTATADYTGYTQMAADVNGDGRADLVYLHPVRIAVWFSKGDGLPFHAKTVKDPLGGVTSLAYTPSSAYQNTLMPFILQAVSSITRDDGRGHSYTTQYSYAGGLFDPVEREFLGFRYAASYQMRDASTYESKTEAWYHQDTTRKGLIEAELTTSFEGHTRQVNNTWTIGTMTGGVTWPRLDTVQSAITDAGYAPYAYSIDYVYDPVYLNVTREYRYGASEEEDVDTFFTYTNYTTPWIVARPTSVTVRDAAGNIKSARWMTYHAATGNLFTEEVCKSDIPASECVNSNPTRNPVITYQYTTEGNVSAATDPMDHATSYTYDAAAKTFVYETVNAAGHVTRTVYHPDTGKLTSLVPPHLYGTGYAITSQYDVFGRLTREDRPDGGYTTYLYANLGNPAAQFVEKKEHIAGGSSPIDHYSDAFFDGLGRTYRVWSSGPEGKTIALDTGYDVIGRVSHRSNPYFAGIDTQVYTTFQYDGLSRITHTTSPDSGQVITSYQGLTRQVRDQNGHWSASTYDVHNRLRVTQDACGIVTAYTYDTLGNLIQVAAAYGQSEQNVTAMTYDSMGKKRSMTDPDMGYWTYSYDKAGNLTSQTDAKGQTVAFTYDAINRLIQKVYPTHTVASIYDDPSVPYSKGMLTSTLDPSGGETKEDSVLAFDIMQRATGSQKTIGASSITISKTYDTSGRTLTMTYGTNPQRSYGYVYDVAGNTVGLWDYTTSSYHVQYSGHTASGQPTGALFPKPNTVSIRTSYTYDPYTMRLDTLVTERLQGQNPVATLQHLTYDHDLKGNILTLADTVNTITHTYTYDALDRLTTANGTGSTPYSHTYVYDVIGNITSRSDVGSYTYLYGNKPHAVRQAGNLSFQYDANGNMTQRYDGSTAVTLDITWNYDNKPSVISRRVGGGASQPYLTFTYDGSSQRVKKENHFTGATTLYFGEVYEVRNGEPIIHLFANNQRVASIQEDGRMQYYHGNHLNSASVVTDGYGNTKETIEYYPFGTYRQRTDLDAAFPNVHHTFTGQEEDDETGLLNYKARLYDPLLGRFISADSIVPEPGNLQAYNRYSYCLNNPLIYTDPSGHGNFFEDLWDSITSSEGLTVLAISTIAFAGAGAIIGAIETSAFNAAFVGAEMASIAYAPAYTLSTGAVAAIHAAAGAAAGALGAGITGGDIGNSAIIGAVSGGLGTYSRSFMPQGFGSQLVGRSMVGGVTGGIAAELYGRNFAQGFGQGAGIAAMAYLFNENEWAQKGWDWFKGWIGERSSAVDAQIKSQFGPNSGGVRVELPAIDFQKIKGGQLALGAYQTIEGLGSTGFAITAPFGVFSVAGPVGAAAVALTVSPIFVFKGILELSHGPSNMYKAVVPAVSTYRLGN